MSESKSLASEITNQIAMEQVRLKEYDEAFEAAFGPLLATYLGAGPIRPMLCWAICCEWCKRPIQDGEEKAMYYYADKESAEDCVEHWYDYGYFDDHFEPGIYPETRDTPMVCDDCRKKRGEWECTDCGERILKGLLCWSCEGAENE